jgi:DNA-binding beta-propeller fold protein YncE
MRRALLVLMLAVAASPSSNAGRLGGTPVALVTAETENELVEVEVPNGRILGRLHLPGDPQNVVATNHLAVVVSTSAGAVTLVDPSPLRVVRVFRGFGAPHIPAVSPDGRFAYVTDDVRGQLDTIDLRRRRLTSRLFVGLGAHHLAISPAAKRIWVALGERARTIAVVDAEQPAKPRLVARIHPRGGAHDLAFGPQGHRVWVTYDDRSSIGVFDAATGRLVHTIPAGSPPQHVAFDPFSNATRAYVTSGDDGTLRIVSLRTGRTIRVVRTAPGSFNVTTGGSLVLTSSLTTGTLTELDDTGRRLMQRKVAPTARDVALVVLP